VEDTVKIIMDNAGLQFDPIIADVFFEVKEQFRSVSQNYANIKK